VRQAALEQELTAGSLPQPLLHPNLAEVYRQRVAALDEALHHPASRAEAFDTIRSLIDAIRLVPENGAPCIEIKGELGGILALCDASDTTKPGRERRALAEQT
jgi:hypothetical protein